MANGGTKIHCPKCKAIKICTVVPLYQLKKPKARNWRREDHNDIQWFRRGRRCTVCGHQFLSAELSEKFVEELVKGRQLLAKKNRQVVARIRRKTPWLRRKEKPQLNVAKEFIKHALFWNHPSGNAVSVPSFSQRICERSFGWSLDLGANTLLIGKAIQRCKDVMNDYFDRAMTGQLIPEEELEALLRMRIRGSVANVNGDEYGQYPDNGGEMLFGVHYIDLRDAVDFFMKLPGVRELCVKANG